MIRLITLCIVAGSLTTGAVAGEELLTHGSPAPKFEAGSFLRGPGLAGLSAAEKLYEQLRSEKYSENDLNDQKDRITKLREDLTKYGRE